MIVWGGFSDLGDTNDGRRYNPSTDSWLLLPPLVHPLPEAITRQYGLTLK